MPADARETFIYPPLLSGDFWRSYAEPVAQVWDALRVLQKVLVDIAQRQEHPKKAQLGRLAFEWLEDLAGTVRPIVRPNSLEWAADTLLGALALEASMDITRVRWGTCERCGAFFTTRAWRRNYCSDSCANTVRKRRQRAAKRKRASRPKTRRK